MLKTGSIGMFGKPAGAGPVGPVGWRCFAFGAGLPGLPGGILRSGVDTGTVTGSVSRNQGQREVGTGVEWDDGCPGIYGGISLYTRGIHPYARYDYLRGAIQVNLRIE